MKTPVLAKRYKVFWTYYVSETGIAHKTFEHCTRTIAKDWVRKVLAWPLTFAVHVTDYEGNMKRWVVNTTDDLLRKRSRLLEQWAEKFEGDKGKAAEALRKLGDNGILNLPVNVRQFILENQKRRKREKEAKLRE